MRPKTFSSTQAAPSPPSLSLPISASITTTTATVGCSTDTSSGTLYTAVTTSPTAPSVAALKAGIGFVFASNQAITTSGAKTFSVTGLSSSTTYYHYYVHNNANGDSNVLSGSSFSTIALAPPTLTSATTSSITSTTATSGVTTDSNIGTLYVAVTTSPTPPTASAIKAGTGFVFAASQTVTNVGAKTFNITGLTSSTTYYHHNVHSNVNGDSNVLSSGSFTTSAGTTYILDTLGASATVAYSLRKLRGAYTSNSIRVRRSSDNAEQDIGFSGSVLDTSALLTFAGTGNAFVVTWFDQSGNSLNLTQSNTSAQATIVFSGTVVTVNGVPWLNMPVSGSMSTAAGFTWSGTVCMSAVSYTAQGSYRRLVNIGGDNLCLFGSVNGNYGVFVGNGGGWNDINANTPATTITTPSVISFINNGSTLTPFINGVTQNNKTGTTITSTNQVFGVSTFGSQQWGGSVAELIAWNGLSTTDRRALEVNQGSYYGVTV